MRRALVILAVLLLLGCAPHVSANPAEQGGAKPYSRQVYVANPEPSVRCYIVVDGAPATVAMSCLLVSR